MTLRIPALLVCAAWLAAAEAPPCHSVEGERIRAADLASVLPQFAAVPSDTLLAPSPLPGSQRSFHASELQALAHRFSITLPPASEACFEWDMQPLDRTLAVEAMQKSLALDGAEIEIADMISSRVPPGRIEFPLNRLGAPNSQGTPAPVLWRGDVVYGDNRRFAIWARVGIKAPCRKLIAAGNLRAGQPIEAGQLLATAATCFPVSAKNAPALGEVAGMVPLRSIPAGSELRPEYLAAANDINRGDTVQVEVRSGSARLALTGKAVSGGRNGDTISVRNPESNKIFQARITGKGTAVVEAGLKGS